MKLDSRTYTNLILTVIAVLLVALLVSGNPLQTLDPATPVQAAEDPKGWQVQQDPLVAAATEKVAAANQEIARQIGRVADAMAKEE